MSSSLVFFFFKHTWRFLKNHLQCLKTLHSLRDLMTRTVFTVECSLRDFSDHLLERNKYFNPISLGEFSLGLEQFCLTTLVCESSPSNFTLFLFSLSLSPSPSPSLLLLSLYFSPSLSLSFSLSLSLSVCLCVSLCVSVCLCVCLSGLVWFGLVWSGLVWSGLSVCLSVHLGTLGIA